MLKLTSLALAAAVAATAAIPSVALAIDHGPCDHCTMEPILVKGERPKKEQVEMPVQDLKVVEPAPAMHLQIPTIGKPTVPAAGARN